MSAAAFAAWLFHAAGAVLGTLPPMFFIRRCGWVRQPISTISGYTVFSRPYRIFSGVTVDLLDQRARQLPHPAHGVVSGPACSGREVPRLKRSVTVYARTVLSIAWFSANKVYTEINTFCVTTIGVILAMRNQLIAGAVFMAIAATQNPGYPLFRSPCCSRALADWKLSYSRWEVIGVVLTVVLLANWPTISHDMA